MSRQNEIQGQHGTHGQDGIHGPGPSQSGEVQGWRRSRLGPHPGVDGPALLAMADLHNHSLHSDGSGDPETAFAQLRAAGLHAAALTDHSSIPRHLLGSLREQDYPDAAVLATVRTAPRSIDDAEWAEAARIADRHDVPGAFVALRGFEWTEPWLGHVNVWFSDTYVPVTAPASMDDLFSFVDGAEPDALFGYNHPGRERGELGGFRRPTGDLAERLTPRMVALEVFNRRDDYLFSPRPGAASPLVACLDAGWRPALIGCSDEHGRDYGLAGKGRTGLWVAELSRAGVREALVARRAYATRERDLRLDARLDGVPGGGRAAGPGGGSALLEVDLAAPDHDGRPVELQLLTGRDGAVDVVASLPAVCGEPVRTRVALPADLAWLVLRVADPALPHAERPGHGGAPAGHPCDCRALAYASPWYR